MTSTCWPRPVSSRACRAARMPMVGVQAGHHVEDRDARAERLGVGAAGQAHQARHRLDDEVVAGQHAALLRRTEAADGGVDDARVGRGDVVVAEAEAGEPAGPEVLHHDVGAARRAPGRASRSLVVLEVEGDRALVAVDAEVVRRDAVAHRRLPGAGVVTGRRLDLDHLGAEVGQQHRGVGAGQDPREVGDQQPGKRSGRSVGHGGPLLGCGQVSGDVSASLGASSSAVKDLLTARSGTTVTGGASMTAGRTTYARSLRGAGTISGPRTERTMADTGRSSCAAAPC